MEKKDAADIGGDGRNECAVSAQVAVRALAVGDRPGALVEDPD